MKKSVLLVLAIGTGLSAWATTPRNAVAKQKFRDPRRFEKLDPNQITTPQLNLAPVQNPQLISSSAITRIPVGSSPNLFTALVAESNCLTANQQVNTVAFTRRKNADGPGNSGYIQVSVSTDGGSAWDTTRSVISDETHLCRYPSGTLYNPPGNTTANQAFHVGSGPWHPGANWQGNFFASQRLDGQFRDSVIQDNTNPGQKQDFARIGFQASDNGKVYVMGAEYLDANATTAAGQGFIGGVLNTGTFDAPNNKFNWSTRLFKHPATIDPTDGSRNIYSTTHTAWSQDGNTGYIVMAGQDSLTPERGFGPIVYKSTDAGQTWTHMTNTDFRNVTNLVSRLRDNNQGTKSPLFTAGQGWDVTVDYQNNLHIATSVRAGSTASVDSVFYSWTSQKSILFDVFTTANGWDAIVLDSLQTDSVSAGSSYWTASTGNDVWDARLQISRSTDGKRLFYGWMDTDVATWGGTENLFPDLFVKGYNVETNKVTPTMNMTKADAVSGGKVFWMYFSNIMLKSDSTYKILATSTDSRNRTSTIDDGLPVQHTFLNGLTITESQFNLTPNGTTGFATLQGAGFSGSVYPNPAADLITVEVEGLKQERAQIRLTNLSGQSVYNESFRNNGGVLKANIDLSGITKGVYLLQIITDNGTAVQRVVKQ